jgi:catechol 2,3-dioxygenase-like lactoylglutathione lyase family enzyme
VADLAGIGQVHLIVADHERSARFAYVADPDGNMLEL